MLRLANVLGALTALALVLTNAQGLAFCRSTTCTGDCPRDDDGCKTTGAKLAWPTSCVGFSLQKDGTMNLPFDVVQRVVERSFVAWSSVACDGGDASMAFSRLADAACHKAEYDPSGPNANIVLFQDDKWKFDGLDDTIAKTTVSFDVATGVIQDADIQLNYAYNDLTTGDTNVVYDLESVITHEIGHFVGLDHSPDPDATMFASYDVGSITQRTLAPDDIAGLCAIYPTARDARCDPTPHGGFTAECAAEHAAASGGCALDDHAPGGGSRGALALTLVVSAALARRRRHAR